MHAAGPGRIRYKERGSYRSADVVEALQWALEPAAKPSDSIIVMLDWYAGHLTDEVSACIRGMGHVPVFHGGGVTGLEQINDTHLHAVVQRELEQLETAEQHRQLKENPGRVPRLTRQAALSGSSISPARPPDRSKIETPAMPTTQQFRTLLVLTVSALELMVGVPFAFLAFLAFVVLAGSAFAARSEDIVHRGMASGRL